MRQITKQLFLLFILNLVLSILIKQLTGYFETKNPVFALNHKYNQTALDHTIWIFKGDIGDDSWRPMQLALGYWAGSKGQGLIYSELLIKRNWKFQYPPTTLLISEFIKANNIDTLKFATVTTFIFMSIMAVGATLLALYSYKEYSAPTLSMLEKIVIGILLTLLLLTFYPAVKAGTLGQIQVWLNSIFVIAILSYITGYETLAGILLGIMASIKPQYALFILWGLFRGNKRLVIAMIVTGAVGLIFGIREFGIANYIDYLRGLSFMAHHGESYFPNQSFNGLIGRLFHIKYPDSFNNTKWVGFGFPSYNIWVFTFTQITSITILAIALIKGKSEIKESRIADFCLMGLAVTMASPIAWEHHYGILFPIFICLWLILWYSDHGIKNNWGKIVLVACYLVAANAIPFTNLLAETYLNFVQSYLFFAACGVFALLVFVKHQFNVNAGQA